MTKDTDQTTSFLIVDAVLGQLMLEHDAVGLEVKPGLQADRIPTVTHGCEVIKSSMKPDVNVGRSRGY